MTKRQRRLAALKGWRTRRARAAFRASPLGRLLSPGFAKVWRNDYAARSISMPVAFGP